MEKLACKQIYKHINGICWARDYIAATRDSRRRVTKLCTHSTCARLGLRGILIYSVDRLLFGAVRAASNAKRPPTRWPTTRRTCSNGVDGKCFVGVGDKWVVRLVWFAEIFGK